MNKTDQRIIKLLDTGLDPDQVARKIGRPGNTDRVMDAIPTTKILKFRSKYEEMPT